MPWSEWIELKFSPAGVLDKSPLKLVPSSSGVYAIGSKKRTGLFMTHYVGRSSRSIRERLEKHLGGAGNAVIAMELALKRDVPSAPMSMWVAFLQTTEPKIVEALYLDSDDIPICNIYRACLPPGVSEELLRASKLDK